MVDRERRNLLEATLSVLQASRGEQGIMEALSLRLPRLLSAEHSSEAVQSAIAAILTFTLPLFHNGREAEPNARLDILVHEANLRWEHRLDKLPEELHIRLFLYTPSWSDAVVKILSAMMYRSSAARNSFRAWVDAGEAGRQEIGAVIVVLHAYLDSSPLGALTDDSSWVNLFERLLESFFGGDNGAGLQDMCRRCILAAIQSSADSSTLLRHLKSKVESVHIGTMNANLVVLGAKLHEVIQADAEDIVSAIVDLGLQWAVRCLSDDTLDKPKFHPVFKQLCMCFTKWFVVDP